VAVSSQQGLEAAVRSLLDRQEIEDCLRRYARGVDRLDEELIRSAFHPDAVDNHVAVNGSVDDFLAWLLPRHRERRGSLHHIGNVSIDLDGDVAHVEAYYVATAVGPDPAVVEVNSGRYVDHFERREGEWRIALRRVVPETYFAGDASELSRILGAVDIARRDRTDPSYERPPAPP
jgi:hypothetical protein